MRVEGAPPFAFFDELIGDLQRLLVTSYFDLPASICFGMTCKRFHQMVLTGFDFMDVLDLQNDVSCALGRSGSIGLAVEFMLAGWSLSLPKFVKHLIIHNHMAAVEHFIFLEDTVLVRYKAFQFSEVVFLEPGQVLFEMVSEWFGRSGNLAAITNFRLGEGRSPKPLDMMSVCRGMLRQGHTELIFSCGNTLDLTDLLDDAARFDRLDYLKVMTSQMGSTGPAELAKSVEKYPFPDLLEYLIKEKIPFSVKEAFTGALHRPNSSSLKSLKILQGEDPSLFQAALAAQFTTDVFRFPYINRIRLLGEILENFSIDFFGG